MTAVVLLRHPETHQDIQAYYHMGSIRDAYQSPTGVITWKRFKDLPWAAKISGSPFFSSEALDAQHTRTMMKEIPLNFDVQAAGYTITSSKGFNGLGCAKQQFVDILQSSPSPTIQAHIDNADKKLRVHRENREKLVKELQQIKTFVNETIEAAPFDGYGYRLPRPHALKNLCDVCVSSPIGASSLSIFSKKDILLYFTID